MCGWLGKLKKAEFGGHVAWSILKCYHSAPDLQMWTSIPSQPVSILNIIKYIHFLNALLTGLLFSHSVMSESLQPHGLQHARLPCPPVSSTVCSSSYPLSWWCYVTISSSVTPFFYLQSFPASGSFPMNWLFTSGKILELQLQHQSFRWIFRVDFL